MHHKCKTYRVDTDTVDVSLGSSCVSNSKDNRLRFVAEERLPGYCISVRGVEVRTIKEYIE